MAVCALLLEKGQDVVSLQGHAAALYFASHLGVPICQLLKLTTLFQILTIQQRITRTPP